MELSGNAGQARNSDLLLNTVQKHLIPSHVELKVFVLLPRVRPTSLCTRLSVHTLANHTSQWWWVTAEHICVTKSQL